MKIRQFASMLAVAGSVAFLATACNQAEEQPAQEQPAPALDTLPAPMPAPVDTMPAVDTTAAVETTPEKKTTAKKPSTKSTTKETTSSGGVGEVQKNPSREGNETVKEEPKVETVQKRKSRE